MKRRSSRTAPVTSVDLGASSPRGQFLTAASVNLYAFAGRATLTVESARTGQHFTYLIEEGDRPGFFFVKAMTGSDNNTDYQYLGFYRDTEYHYGRKSRIGQDAPSAVAFEYLSQVLRRGGALPRQLRVFHEGRCGACRRKLTVPASILTGLGPECSSRLGVQRAVVACDNPFGLDEAA